MNPYSSIPQYPLIRDHELSVRGAQYKVILDKVNSIIQHLLYEISSIYVSAGIFFEVKPLIGVLIRILTPFQILSYFHLNDIQGIVKSQPNDYTYTNFDETNLKYEANPQDLKLIPSLYQPQYEQKNPKKKKATKKDDPKKEGQRIKRHKLQALTEQEETKLVRWIHTQIKLKKYVRRQDISYMARKYKNDPHFIGSKNWVINFLNRYPTLRSEVNMIARENKGRKPLEQIDSSLSSKNLQQFEMSNQLLMKKQEGDQIANQEQIPKAENQSEQFSDVYSIDKSSESSKKMNKRGINKRGRARK